MTTNLNWHDILTYHVEDSWQALVKLALSCAALNLADPKLVHYELMGLKDKLREAKDREDAAQLEACLSQCKHLLLYYTALQRQKQRVDETGSAFAQRALERLMVVNGG